MKTEAKTNPTWAIALIASVALSLSASAQSSAVPGLMTYQGFVTDSSNDPLGSPDPTNYDVIFRIYDSATGNNIIWAEQQTVTIFQGNFSVLLGNGQVNGGEPNPDLDQVFTARERFMGITVDTGAGSTEFTPRQRIMTNAYAYRAKVAENVSNLLYTSGGNVGIGTTAPSELLQIRGGNDPTLLLQSDGTNEVSGRVAMRQSNLSGYDVYYDGTSRDGLAFESFGGGASNGVAMFIKQSNRYVGIGTTAPARQLHVSGASPSIAVTDVAQGQGASDGLQMGINSSSTWLWNYENTPIRFGANNGEKMRLMPNGRIGVNNTAPLAQLHVTNGILGNTDDPAAIFHVANCGAPCAQPKWTEAIRLLNSNGNGRVGIGFINSGNGDVTQVPNAYLGTGDGTSSARMEASVRVGGALVVAARLTSAGWSNVSDLRIKKEVEELDGMLDVALNLQPVKYWFNHDPEGQPAEQKRIGFIAQEVEQYLPSLVTEHDDLKTLNYSEMSAVAIGAVKEQHAIVERQSQRIGLLEEENAELRKRLDRIEELLSK